MKNSAGLVILILLSVPGLFSWEDSLFLIHDYLDSNVVNLYLLANSEHLYASFNQNLDWLLGGVPRGAMPSFLYIPVQIYNLFGLVGGSLINEFLIRIIAYVGMQQLMRELQFLKTGKLRSEHPMLITLISMAFALLPFWPPAGLSVAGQPLLVALLISLNRENKILTWALFIFIALYSRLPFSGLFLLIELGLLGVLVSAYNKRIYWRSFLGLSFFALFSLLVEFQLIQLQLSGDFASQRGNAIVDGSLNFFGMIGTSAQLFFKGQYHSHIAAMPELVAVLIIAFLFFVKRMKSWVFYILLVSVQFAFVLLGQLPKWNEASVFLEDIQIFRSLQFRFYTILPLFWHAIAALPMIGQNKMSRYATISIYALLIIGCSRRILDVNIEDATGSNYSQSMVSNIYRSASSDEYSTMENFYSTAIFDIMKKDQPDLINQKIACVGFLPQLAQMNGYSTVGGYFALYNKSHHQSVLRLMEKELEKNKNVYESYKNWGSKCYLYSHEMAQGEDRITKLNYDFTVFGELNCSILVSSSPIQGIKHIQPISEYHVDEGELLLSHIYVYRLVDDKDNR